MTGSSESSWLNKTVWGVGTIGAITTIVLAIIAIGQSSWQSKGQGQAEETAIAISVAQLEIQIEQATLEAFRSTNNANNDITETLVANRLRELEATSTSLDIIELQSTIEALEQSQLELPITSTPQNSSSPVYQIEIQSTRQKNFTGIDIQEGDLVQVQFLEGKWRAGPLPTWPFYGPSGDPQVSSKETFPVRDKPIMSLIGGIGNQQPFAIGVNLEFRSSIGGEFWLGANDDNFSDNDGSLIVIITVIQQ